MRVGGFGGVDGLAAWLRAHGTDAVVDATHPFAVDDDGARGRGLRRSSACRCCGCSGPAWSPVPGDDWRPVPISQAAAEAVAAQGERVFLTTGRTGLAVFAPVDRWFLVRSVDPPEPPVPAG